MIHARIVPLIFVGFALSLLEAAGQEPVAPPKAPATPPTNSAAWQQVLDNQNWKVDDKVIRVQATVPPRPATPPVQPTQTPPTPATTVPALPGTTPPTAPATTAPANPALSVNDPNNPFLGINSQPPSSIFSSPTGAAPAEPRQGFLQMIGDQSPFLSLHAASTVPSVPSPPSPFPPKTPPSPPSPRQTSALAPSVRGLKIGENQSPQPQDRVFYSFNYYSNLNATIDKRFDTPINNVQAYRSIFGFEKTFDQGRASFGMVLPLDTLSASSTIKGNFAKPGGVSTAVGDLSIFTKFIIRQNMKTGSLFSGGLVVTAPTGPASFAGANYISAIHTTQIQPYIGYIFRREKYFLHGFSSFSFPMNPNDVTLMYNDIGVGYFLYQDPNFNSNNWITAVVPTSEIHINSPLNHQNPYNPNDIAGSANVVNLTQGLNIEMRHRSIITFGIATPITTPRPFDLEALILFNFRFGGSRRTLTPILGG